MTLKQFAISEGRGSLARVARAVGTSKGYLSDIANGRRKPSPALAAKIQTATDGKVKAAALVGLEAA